MSQLLIHLPDSLANRFRSIIPAKQRSKYIEKLLIEELKKTDLKLMASALALEKDVALNDLIDDFDITIGDGVDGQK